MRKRLDSHWRASRSIEHPQRQFQPTTGRALIMATAGHGARHLVDHLMNLNGASCPRMPKIENFALLGPMGVASWRCTMASVHIRALTALRRTRPTSPSCPSAWQPNPGRGSTYRRGNSVQRIETTARYPGFDLELTFSDHGIRTVITVGTQVQTAVLHTAAEAALRGYKVIVPIDGMSGDSLYPEQYTAWHLANTQRVMQQVTLTKVDLIGY